MQHHKTDCVFHWLFIGAQPSSGSTFLARLLNSLPRAAEIAPRSEGQWLVPDLVAGENRWNPHAPQSLAEVRRVWLRAAKQIPDDRYVIVEKSPPNLCRMPRLLDLFSDMPQTLILLTRDPMAICASWAGRYSLPVIVEEWIPKLDQPFRDERDFHRLLGRLCGERFRMQSGLRRICAHTVAYEDLVADAVATIRTIAGICPDLGVPDTEDPALAEARDLNPGLISRLSPDARHWISEGLAPFEADIAPFGYTIDG